VVTANGMKTDVVSVFPATMINADMRPDNAGSWFFHCHVNDHLTAGMSALYTVTK
jgi:manganese oxidase